MQRIAVIAQTVCDAALRVVRELLSFRAGILSVDNGLCERPLRYPVRRRQGRGKKKEQHAFIRRYKDPEKRRKSRKKTPLQLLRFFLGMQKNTFRHGTGRYYHSCGASDPYGDLCRLKDKQQTRS